MRRMFCLIVVSVGAGLPFVVASPALACVCAGPPSPTMEFVGEALDGATAGRIPPVWRFRVVSGRGVEPDAVVPIVLDVERPSPDGGLVSSSCGLGAAPQPGGLYRVGASESEINGNRRLFASQCSGYLEVATATDTHDRPAASRPPWFVLVTAAAAMLGAAAFTVRAARTP